MNFKTTILLVGVLVLIGGALYFFVPGDTGKPALPETAAPPAPEKTAYVFTPQPDPDKLARVVVEAAGKPRMVFERIVTEPNTPPAPGGPQWRLVEPAPGPVEAYVLRGLTSALTSLQVRDRFEPGAKDQPALMDTGLEPPAATVTMTGDDGKTYALEIGKKVVMSEDTYVRVPGEKQVAIAKRDLAPLIKKELSEYRSKKLADFKVDNAVALQVTCAGTKYAFSRGADGEWVIEEPLRANADREKVRGLLTRLAGLRADEFADGDAGTAGLATPYLTMSVTTETRPAPSADPNAAPPPPTKETCTLTVGGFADLKSEKRYARLGETGAAVIVSETNVKGLVPNLKELRDARVLRVKAADITALDVTSGGTTVALKKVDGTWQGSGELVHLEIAAVEDVLAALEELKAIDYLDQPEAPATYGLAQPRTILTVTTTGAAEPLTLRIGAETASGRNAYVQRAAAGDAKAPVIVTSAAQAARLAINGLSLRSREVFDFAPEQLQHLTLQRDGTTYKLTQQHGLWQLIEPNAPLAKANASALATDLAHLRAKRIVAKDELAAVNFSQPTVTIQFDIAPPTTSQPATQPAGAVAAESHTLRVVNTPSAAFGRKDDEPYVFVVDETVYSVLTQELIAPKLFAFDPNSVVDVRIVHAGKTLEFTKTGEQWKYAADPFVELDQAKVSTLVKDITQLEVERFVAYQNGDLAAHGLADTTSQLAVKLADGTEIIARLAAERDGEPPVQGALAAQQRIFRLRAADAEKLVRGLDDYVKSDKPAAPPPGLPPGMQGGPGLPPGMPPSAAPRPTTPPPAPRP